jgi:DNA modification methylase
MLLLNANAKRIPIADGTVNCVVTSPPYFGLRDYGTAEWVGGDAECEHNPQRPDGGARSDRSLPLGRGGMYREVCGMCGAIRVDNQIGLEQTPDDYVAGMVQVFREVWRVLRDDGTVWLNLGDSYAVNGIRTSNHGQGGSTLRGGNVSPDESWNSNTHKLSVKQDSGLKPKDLIGIPWRVAFALQADGWWLRQDIIWEKPNPMPESVKDRCTKAHEYIFLLTKSARYWYDNEAVKEDFTDERMGNPGGGGKYAQDLTKTGYRNDGDGPVGRGIWNANGNHSGRNKRSVWTVTTKPYSGAHYAVFPPDLIEPCVLAGCPPKVCAKCGAPWERVVERLDDDRPIRDGSETKAGNAGVERRLGNNGWNLPSAKSKTIGWQPTCDCDADIRPGIVLDPFIGSGTTAMVARKHGRNAIGLDLNFDYLNTNARERLQYGSYVPVADGVTQLTIKE